ncbi:MAG: hypothetical protein D6696_06430 [Acidobacteria bacterium]|nr:MAG: hypothetical protein D6696_06430 [Acidobacteriota bacterium]
MGHLDGEPVCDACLLEGSADLGLVLGLVAIAALGQTAAGRYLQVVYVPDPGRRSLFVITAYDLRGKALTAYRRRRRRKRS